MGWFAGQLLILLLVAFLIGLLAGYLWWIWGWKKYRDEQVTTDVDRQQRSGSSDAGSDDAGKTAVGSSAVGATGAAAGGAAGGQIRTLVGGDGTTVGAGGGAAGAGSDCDVIDLTDGATLAALSADLDEARALLADRSAELESARVALAARTEELDAGRSSLEAAEQSALEAQAELRTNQEALASVGAELRAATDQLDACGQARSELQTRLDALQAELDGAREQARKADAERESIIDLRDENEALREQLRVAALARAQAARDTDTDTAAGSSSDGAGAPIVTFATGVDRVAGDYGDDDLERIEGIGPKIGDALRAAGIRSFPRLLASDENMLRAALEAAGLRFAPSLPTWRDQAAYLVRGDEAGFLAYTDHLVAGRKPGTSKGAR